MHTSPGALSPLSPRPVPTPGLMASASTASQPFTSVFSSAVITSCNTSQVQPIPTSKPLQVPPLRPLQPQPTPVVVSQQQQQQQILRVGHQDSGVVSHLQQQQQHHSQGVGRADGSHVTTVLGDWSPSTADEADEINQVRGQGLQFGHFQPKTFSVLEG